MKRSLLFIALLTTVFITAGSQKASAVVYCQYISYPVGCVARPGVVLVARPVARAVVTPGVGAPGVGVRPGTPTLGRDIQLAEAAVLKLERRTKL